MLMGRLENGDMGKELIFGSQGPCMRVSGVVIELRGRAVCGTVMVTCIMASLKRARPVDLVYTSTKWAQNTRECGMMTYNMAKAKSCGQMAKCIWVATKEVCNTALEFGVGPTAASTKASGSRVLSLERAFKSGQTA